MNQKEKVQLLKETLGELCEELGTALDRAKDVLHELEFGPGPATPVVVDLGENLERQLARIAKKLEKRTQIHRKKTRHQSTKR